MTQPIYAFTGHHAYLSNDYPAVLEYEDHKYPTLTHAYEASRARGLASKEPFFCPPPRESDGSLKEKDPKKPARLERHFASGPEARIWGPRIIDTRADWDKMKSFILAELLAIKFQDPGLRLKLLETGDAELAFGNRIPDRVLGTCRGVGENQLGKALMRLREKLGGAGVQKSRRELRDEARKK